MKLFVGLGNPGAKYAQNRHNIGFLALDRIARQHDFGPWKKKFHSLGADGDIGGEKVLLLKPETFMNDSGRAVQDAARFLKIGVEDIVVFHDELDLAPAKVKVKIGGGNAGHNGLRSITAHLDNDYKRVRLGIGHPGSKDAVTHYVLNDFAKSEHPWVDQLLTAVADAAPRLAKGDDARFLTDVARLMQAAEDAVNPPAPRETKTQARPSSASEAKPAKVPAAHPAGERAGKQKTALADNLKKWLAGRKAD